MNIIKDFIIILELLSDSNFLLIKFRNLTFEKEVFLGFQSQLFKRKI
jgi:hypothetical protein